MKKILDNYNKQPLEELFFHKLNFSIDVTKKSVTMVIFREHDLILEDFTRASPKEYVYKVLCLYANLVCKH